MLISQMKDKELIETFKSLYDSINVTECYGVKDLIIFDTCEKELLKRGYSIEENKGVKVTKEYKE